MNSTIDPIERLAKNCSYNGELKCKKAESVVNITEAAQWK
jgi:hypothetical protein